jgi:formamidopyrimidine-DNA glycosylase
MPELPEVQTVVDTLRPALLGRKIKAVRLLRGDIVEPEGVDLPGRLIGATIHELQRRGKRIIFTLHDTHRFFIHLGMSGRLAINSPEQPTLPHTHLIVTFEDLDRELRFTDPRRFGGIWWLGQNACDDGMGPEPLAVRSDQLAQRLAKTTRAIKNALLDQRVLAGLGNIYVDESLFSAGIHPLTRADRLSSIQIRKLMRAIKSTLRRAIRHRGSTLRDYRDANGNAGAFQLLHRVYGREGKPCQVCKTPIQRIVLGGRSTHFCPRCQRRTR